MNEREHMNSVLEALPLAGYLFGLGLFFLVAGFGLDRLGYYVESGVVAAFAVFILSLAVVAQSMIWILGQFD